MKYDTYSLIDTILEIIIDLFIPDCGRGVTRSTVKPGVVSSISKG